MTQRLWLPGLLALTLITSACGTNGDSDNQLSELNAGGGSDETSGDSGESDGRDPRGPHDRAPWDEPPPIDECLPLLDQAADVEDPELLAEIFADFEACVGEHPPPRGHGDCDEGRHPDEPPPCFELLDAAEQAPDEATRAELIEAFEACLAEGPMTGEGPEGDGELPEPPTGEGG